MHAIFRQNHSAQDHGELASQAASSGAIENVKSSISEKIQGTQGLTFASKELEDGRTQSNS